MQRSRPKRKTMIPKPSACQVVNFRMTQRDAVFPSAENSPGVLKNSRPKCKAMIPKPSTCQVVNFTMAQRDAVFPSAENSPGVLKNSTEHAKPLLNAFGQFMYIALAILCTDLSTADPIIF